MEARRLTGPLFWLHGDESPELLEEMLDKVAESGNGCFTAESRPHSDWLGPGWYRDLEVCLNKAKQLDLKMWIFDEQWWPSQMVGGMVPPEYGSKTLVAKARDIDGPQELTIPGCGGPRFIGAVAGRFSGQDIDDQDIDGAGLIDLTSHVRNDTLTWNVPAGRWKVAAFHWKLTRQKPAQDKPITVDGASPDCVDWYIRTVYQPHYEHFQADFGKTICGFFYDEPETRGDWGHDLMTLLAERQVDWKKAFMAWKFKLAGEEQVAARYQYADALAESWGRTLYGGLSRWCRERDVISAGHFHEHGTGLFNQDFCAGNLMQLQKYSDLGGIDLVAGQISFSKKENLHRQMAKLASSISHVYGKADDLAMCEIFGDYEQELTYPQMKWLTDQMFVRGINYLVTHSFNPRAPYDEDCPPYFYNGGFEPRFPLYRVYADYTNRLGLLLAGGRHVAPVALLYLGQSFHAGRKIRPEGLTWALDDARFDCDWLPYDAFAEARIRGNTIALHEENYRVLVVPAAEVIPYATLAKVKAFYDAGGIVVGYGILPQLSATLGKTSIDMAALTDAVWGPDPRPSNQAIRTNDKGGRSYFLKRSPSAQDIQRALTDDGGLHPALEILAGQTNGWLHVLHRVKSGRDIFFVCNQDERRPAKTFRFRIRADGYPECWDPLRNEITAIPFRRIDGSVEIDLTLEPLETVLLVFQKKHRVLPERLDGETRPLGESIPVTRDLTVEFDNPTNPFTEDLKTESGEPSPLADCNWIWHPGVNLGHSVTANYCWFRKSFHLAPDRRIRDVQATFRTSEFFELYVNGRWVGSGKEEQNPSTFDLTTYLIPGKNVLAIAATGARKGEEAAGLIGKISVVFESGDPFIISTEPYWKVTDKEEEAWFRPECAETIWSFAKIVAPFGQEPWRLYESGRDKATMSPLKNPDPFLGRCSLPGDLDLTTCRVYLEMGHIPGSEQAASVRINGDYAGGVIGKPYRLNVTEFLESGANTIEITPVAPQDVQLVVYGASPVDH